MQIMESLLCPLLSCPFLAVIPSLAHSAVFSSSMCMYPAFFLHLAPLGRNHVISVAAVLKWYYGHLEGV